MSESKYDGRKPEPPYDTESTVIESKTTKETLILARAEIKRLHQELVASDKNFKLLSEINSENIDRIDKLRDALEFYANSDIYKPHGYPVYPNSTVAEEDGGHNARQALSTGEQEKE
jgi:hypothetical protein